MSTLTLVIPLYREASRISDSVRKIAAFVSCEKNVSIDVVFVNDGSPDETDCVVRKCIRETGLRNARVLSYAVNRGKGYAVKTGVLAAEGECILMSDADLSTPLQEWRKLKSALEQGADIACGSRAAKGAEIGVPSPLHRRLLSRLFRFFVRLAGVRGVHDTQCGFKLFKASAVKKIFSLMRIQRFAFDVELIARACDMGYTVVEVPVHWDYSGSSTVHVLSSGARMLWDLFVFAVMRTFRVLYHEVSSS